MNFKIENREDVYGNIKHEVFIDASINKEEVGYLRVNMRTNQNLNYYGGPNEVLKEVLEVCMVKIYKEEDYNKGIATQLYKEFGKLYKQRFNGIPIVHTFSSSVAEYLFRRSIANGDIPIEAHNEAYCFRDDMTDENNALWKTLRTKLPEELQGTEIDWDYEALEKLEAQENK